MSATIVKLIILVLLWLIFCTVVKIIGRQMYASQFRDEPEADPCEDCLRWSECFAVDADICPRNTDGRD